MVGISVGNWEGLDEGTVVGSGVFSGFCSLLLAARTVPQRRRTAKIGKEIIFDSLKDVHTF
jgi:hypothetical protein